MPGTPAPQPDRSPDPDQPIHSLLSGGDPRTLRNVDLVIDAVLAEPVRLDELIGCIRDSHDEVVRMRAADVLEKVCRARPSLVQPHVPLLLAELSRIDQPSVQWHLAQMLGQVRLTQTQRRRAVGLMNRNCEESGDWIVLNCSLETLAILARQDPSIADDLRAQISRHEQSNRKSLASRARRLRLEFGPDPTPPAGTSRPSRPPRQSLPSRPSGSSGPPKKGNHGEPPC